MESAINIQGTLCILLKSGIEVIICCWNSCHCAAGYLSGDCSLRICPFGDAWSDEAIGIDKAHQPAECSNRGICDREKGSYSYGEL